jgi:hypothetical protein
MAQHDWDALYGELARATGPWTRDELVALLRDLIREYVVDRGLPTGTPEAAASPDLTGMDFAQIITWLKRTLTLPELNRFSVDGGRVVVDADGPRVISDAPAPPAVGRPAAPSVGQTATPPAPSPGSPPAAPPAQPDERADTPSAAPRKLSRGFHGLEFD